MVEEGERAFLITVAKSRSGKASRSRKLMQPAPCGISGCFLVKAEIRSVEQV